MKHSPIITLMLIIAVNTLTFSETIIPLPELTGSYTNGVQRTTSFDSGLSFGNINDVQLHLSGSYTQGLLYNLSTGGYETMDWHLKSTTPLAPELWSTGNIQAWGGGPFVLEEFYYPLTQGANWDLLLNGQVEVKLNMPSYVIPAIYSQVIPVAYQVNEASLVVYADCNSIDVTQPNNREYLLAGSTYQIEWLDCRDVPSDSYDLSYSLDNGQNWLAVTANPVSGTFYDWQVPQVSAENCLVKVDDAAGPLSDVSDTPFAIYECTTPPAYDLNSDCYLNLYDYRILAADWLQAGGYDLSDLIGLVENWLNCSNPFDPDCSL